jgi:hypothetical protein
VAETGEIAVWKWNPTANELNDHVKQATRDPSQGEPIACTPIMNESTRESPGKVLKAKRQPSRQPAPTDRAPCFVYADVLQCR